MKNSIVGTAKNFGTKAANLIGLCFIVPATTFYSPMAGFILSLAIILISGIAIFKPIPRLGFTSRFYSGSIFVFIGIIWLGVTYPAMDIKRSNNLKLAALKTEDPKAYLTEIKRSNPVLWLKELSEIDPTEYKLVRERQRITQEQNEARKKIAEKARQCGSDYSGDAFVNSKPYVEAQLKAPATADFPSYLFGQGISSTPIGNCTFKVKAYVDAQNGFGAMMRTYYEVRIKRLPQSGDWQLVSLDMGS
jgi:hypothetical protein